MSNHQAGFVEAGLERRDESKVLDVYAVSNKLGRCVLIKHRVELERGIPALDHEMCVASVQKR